MSRLRLIPATLVFVAALTAQSADPHGLRAGPMLTRPSPHSVVVWLQTVAPASVQIRAWPDGDPARSRLSPVVRTETEGDLIARLVLDGLAPGTRYAYSVLLEGKVWSPPIETLFATPPVIEGTGVRPVLRVALASEPGGQDGSGILPAIAYQRPDLMLWLNDQVDLHPEDLASAAGWRGRYRLARSLPALQPLLHDTHHFALPRDLRPGGPPPSSSQALRVFSDYWALASAGAGASQSFTWGDAEFFLLDGRSDPAVASARASRLAPAQWDWLIEGLRRSRATFKIIASAFPLAAPKLPEGTDGLARYPQDRKRLLRFLKEERIEGVVFLAGSGPAGLVKVEEQGLYPLFEFTPPPFSAAPGAAPPANLFALLELTGPRDHRVLTLRTLDPRGKETWRQVLLESQLRAGPRPTP
jgi:alkaline phosphatase D